MQCNKSESEHIICVSKLVINRVVRIRRQKAAD